MMMWTKRPVGEEGGFSLVELMIAMVVLAIGILATMAMQYTALAGYTSARELTGATEMVRTVEQIIQAEAHGMEMDGDGANPGAAFDMDEGFLEAALDNDQLGEWVLPAGMDTPMTQRLNAGGSDDDGARRYCVYVAGELLDASEEALEEEDGGLSGTPSYARIGIAVVYPGANGSFPQAGPGNPGTCNDNEIIDNLNSGKRIELEVQGLRVTHLSTGVGAQSVGMR